MRYRICEEHLRAAAVLKGGVPQRFCQQCGKLQPLPDFEGNRRSCRARLDRHNARRRRVREVQAMLRKTGRIDEPALREKYCLSSDDEVAPRALRAVLPGLMGGGAGGAHKRGAVGASAFPARKRAAGSPHVSAADSSTHRSADSDNSGGPASVQHRGQKHLGGQPHQLTHDPAALAAAAAQYLLRAAPMGLGASMGGAQRGRQLDLGDLDLLDGLLLEEVSRAGRGESACVCVRGEVAGRPVRRAACPWGKLLPGSRCDRPCRP